MMRKRRSRYQSHTPARPGPIFVDRFMGIAFRPFAAGIFRSMPSRRFRASRGPRPFSAKCRRIRWFTGSWKKLEPGTAPTPTSRASTFAELQVGVKAVAGDVQQHIKGALGLGVGDVQLVQAPQQQIPLVGVQGLQLVIIALVEQQSRDHSLPQGAAAPTVRKSWTFLAVSMISAGAMM